jgi:transcriptional regulator with XRE-family HTH domain
MGTEPAFGQVLRGTRMAQGVSLGELGRRTHYSKGYLSKVEMGLRAPSDTLARLCDTALGADGDLIALVRRPVPPVVDPALVDDDEGHWVLEMAKDGSMWFQPMNRRQAMALGATSLLVLRAGAAPPDRSGQAAAVAAFGVMFPQLRALGQQASPDVVLPTCVTQTHSLSRIAEQSSGATRSTAFTLASRYAEYTGWMAQESGQDQAALWWTDRAVRLAAEGGDEELAAYSKVRRALITLYAGDAVSTVELARQAQRHPAAGARVRGLAAQREAQGHALAGSPTECLLALDRARELLSAADGPTGEPVLGSSTLRDPVGLSTAWCLHDLGRSEESAAMFERELRDVPPTARRFQTRWRARQALAHATARDLDAACAVATGLLDDMATVDSATVRTDLVLLARTLSRWITYGPVRDLYPVLTAAMRPTSAAHA